jgi:hypothetical protein
VSDLPKSINFIVFLQRPTDVGWMTGKKAGDFGREAPPSSNTDVYMLLLDFNIFDGQLSRCGREG